MVTSHLLPTSALNHKVQLDGVPSTSALMKLVLAAAEAVVPETIGRSVFYASVRQMTNAFMLPSNISSIGHWCVCCTQFFQTIDELVITRGD
eukprot:SAG31_NODE_70_length_28117_cov_100.521843_31_plen_92_part_00